MLHNLAAQFRATLINYLKEPTNIENQKALTAASFAIYSDAITACGIEPDKYMEHIDAMIGPALKGIRIHPHAGAILDAFYNDLSWSDLRRENQAFHVLTLAHNNYLLKNLLNPTQLAQKKLERIKTVIDQLAAEHNPYVKELDAAYGKLKMLVNEYIQQTPQQQYANHALFEHKLKNICNRHKTAIESDVRIRTVFYDFLAMASSFILFIGESLANTFHSKSRFFHNVSAQPTSVLDGFSITAPNVEVHPDDEGPTNESNFVI
ncbi:hypothetical protein [Legionella saoudiensis]|uniref:hypothetical protein n=1 Tax=Legionella saoudiensis TaxID=1750561 RepID=UPI00072FB7A3|nr:hypothetical protein [Legionella saoudiensis]